MRSCCGYFRFWFLTSCDSSKRFIEAARGGRPLGRPTIAGVWLDYLLAENGLLKILIAVAEGEVFFCGDSAYNSLGSSEEIFESSCNLVFSLAHY